MGNCVTYHTEGEQLGLQNDVKNQIERNGERAFTQTSLGRSLTSRQFSSQYQIKRLLAVEEDGSTFEVVSRTTGEEFRMRQLSTGLSQEMLQLKHPNLMPILDYFQIQNRAKLVLKTKLTSLAEHCSGVSLLAETQVAAIIFGLLSAVRYLHNQGVIHNRITVNNIFVDQKQQVLLSDYWLCDTPSKTKQQDLPFKAPEQQKDNFNQKCDVWACGVVMHLLLFGKFPEFAGGTILLGRNVTVSDQAKNLLSEMLMSSPKNRISARKCLKHWWFKFVSKRRLSLGTLRDLKRTLTALNFRTKLKSTLSEELGLLRERNEVIRRMNEAADRGGIVSLPDLASSSSLASRRLSKRLEVSEAKERLLDEYLSQEELLEELLRPEEMTRNWLEKLFAKLDEKGRGELSRTRLVSLTKGAWEQLLAGLGGRIGRREFIQRVEGVLGESFF